MISLCFSLCLNAVGQVYEKIKDSDVGPDKIEIAQKFAFNYMTSLKNNSFYSFSDEAIDLLKIQLTEERQKAGYKLLKDKFGDFESLDYAETWIQKDNPSFKILRFKSVFDKSTGKLEIRVILNEADKVCGFWIKPWTDVLN